MNSICPGCGCGIHESARLELLLGGRSDGIGHRVLPAEEIRLCVPCLDSLVFKTTELMAAIKEIVK